MGYYVNYDDLDMMYNSIYSSSSAWLSSLETVLSSVQFLSDSNSITGKGADNVKNYLGSVHGTIVSLLGQIIIAHMNNCLLYKRDYQDKVDIYIHAVINSDTLDNIKSGLRNTHDGLLTVSDNIKSALSSVSDIFSYNPGSSVNAENAYGFVNGHITQINEQINTLENHHYNTDFSEVCALIDATKVFINEQLSKGRSYKIDFRPAVLSGSETFRNLYQCCQVLTKSQDAKSAAISKAIDNENERIEALQSEYEERKRQMDIVKWAVGGLCVIISIAVIVGTGGIGAPLVAGTVSAITGAVMAGTNSMANQYINTGKVEDWGQVGKDVALGAITGFASGCIGSGISNWTTSYLSNTFIGNALVNSQSIPVRIGSSAVIGSVSGVSSGIISRGTVQLIVTGDGEKAWSDAFNPDEILSDAITGGIEGGVEEMLKPIYMGDLMSEEDAALYNEYWRKSGIGSDKTWNEFRQHYPNGTIDDYFEIISHQNPWPEGAHVQVTRLNEGDSFEMVLDSRQSKNKPGRWGTTNEIKDKNYVREELAIKSQWKAQPNKVVRYTVKDGQTLPVEIGPVGPQIDLDMDRFLPGGADQIHILLPDNANPMDYLKGEIIRRF